tara:strand:+ start:15313 stop:16653 length:1341 start_codon:yes stop_codon:yes gene_type:complete
LNKPKPEPHLCTQTGQTLPPSEPVTAPSIQPVPGWVPTAAETKEPDVVVTGYKVRIPSLNREIVDTHPIAKAIELADQLKLAVGRPINVGIDGMAFGMLSLGTGDDANWDRSHPRVDQLSVTIYALEGIVPIGPLRLGNHHRFVKQVLFRDVDIGAHPYSENGIWNEGPVGNLGFDNCSVTPRLVNTAVVHPNTVVQLGSGWRDLFVRNWRRGSRKGVAIRPGDHVFYPKGGGDARFIGCDLGGANRTGINWRPHPKTAQFPASPKFGGKLLIDGCFADDPGWGHDDGTEDSKAGGAVITLWQTHQEAVVRNTRIANARYGCFAAVAQPESATNANYYVPGTNFTHADLHLIDNYWENVDGDRFTAELSCVQSARLWGRNSYIGRGMTIDSYAVNGAWGQARSDDVKHMVASTEEANAISRMNHSRWSHDDRWEPVSPDLVRIPRN